MRKYIVVGIVAAIAGVVGSAQAIEHSLQYTPSKFLVRPGSAAQAPDGTAARFAEYHCIVEGALGSIKAAFGAQGCPNSTNVGVWSAWYRGYVDSPYAPNPGSTETLIWSGQQPANTSLAARPVSFNADGSVYASAAFVYGGSWQSSWVANSDGPVVLDVAIRSKAGGVTSPQIDVVGSQVYSN